MITARTTGGLAAVRLTTGGSGYTAPPSVTISGGGGAGAAIAAYMAGTRVRELVITNSGTGYTSDPTVTIAGNAEATASAHTANLRPMKFLRSRQGVLIGVDGMGRGIRWDGRAETASPVGLLEPQYAPGVTVAATTGSQYIASIDLIEQGSGYSSPPVVNITGGTPSEQAEARAIVVNGRVSSIDITKAGAGYQSPPTISLSGGNPSGATFSLGVSGRLSAVEVTSQGSGYTATPAVTFSNTGGLTNASVRAVTDGDKVTEVIVSSAGTGATTTPTLAIEGNASVAASVLFTVSSATIVSGGQGFLADAAITFTPDPLDQSVRPAAATAKAGGGQLTSVTIIGGGEYSIPPTASVEGLDAKAVPRLSPNLLGKYYCAVRYISRDDEGSPIPSSISDISEVDAGQGASSLAWNVTHGFIDDRVTHAELWRSTGDQRVLLYRVATIARASFNSEYTDSLSDSQLIDVERDDYGLLPVTLPSGQVNARRFGVLPGNFAVGVMFQDRAWFAVDTTGENPNSLIFSEVDEPESVPPVNELVVQESVGDSDEIVALVPLSSMLLIVQRRHIYKLQYVAQPVIDASILLAAYRGTLNRNCCDVMGGVAYIADSHGMYAFDGSNVSPISVAIDDYWREGVIDFSKSSKFFVRCDDGEMVARFFYCEAGSSEPDRALCYSIATKAWWKEEYAFGVRCGGNQIVGSQHKTIYGTSQGNLAVPEGQSDDGTPIDYSVKTGNFAFDQEPSRAVGVLYTPTASTSSLRLKLYYNGAATPRDNAVNVDRGGAFTADATGGVLDMRLGSSHLADSVGYAKARYSGRGSDFSGGADRHVAVELSGSKSSTSDSPEIHAITIEGVG